ncbi:MAG TPA: hypothetical protein VK668_23015 [Mucilaginibacter sp.]|nr:hypothetical protein [Mucilaginibacter sp.]
MRIILLFFIALFICYSTNAQSSKDYREGYYYNLSKQKITGLVIYDPSGDYIRFKPNNDAKAEKIKIKEITAVGTSMRVGIDSLTVLTEDNKENKKYFAHFILATPTTRLYYKYITYRTNSGGPNMIIVPANTNANGTTIKWTNSNTYYSSESYKFTMYQEGDTTYKLTKSNYIEVLSKAFADVPDLVKRIQNKEFSFKKITNLFYEYRTQTSFKVK